MKKTKPCKGEKNYRIAGGFRTFCRAALASLLISQSVVAQQLVPESSDTPKNIIIFVADGLGFAQLSLAMQMHSEQALWQRFSATGWHQPNPQGTYITDSAGSATALATGTSTLNESIGVDENGKRLDNVFELDTKRVVVTGDTDKITIEQDIPKVSIN